MQLKIKFISNLKHHIGFKQGSPIQFHFTTKILLKVFVYLLDSSNIKTKNIDINRILI